MYHATTQDLQPAGVFADIAPRAAAENAFDIHLGAGLGEGEMLAAETGPDIRAKEPAGKAIQRPFQV